MERRDFLKVSFIVAGGLAVGLKLKTYTATVQWSQDDWLDRTMYMLSIKDPDGRLWRYGAVGDKHSFDEAVARRVLTRYAAKALNVPESSIIICN